LFLAIRDFTVKWIGYENVYAGLKDLGLKSFELYMDRELKGAKYRDMGEEVPLGFDLSTSEKRRELSEQLGQEGLTVCAILVENDFARTDLKSEIDWIVRTSEVAPQIGCDTVRINPPMRIQEGISEGQYLDITIDCCREILERTKTTGVSLAMENHGVMGNRFEFLRGVLESIGSERMGLNLDTGNFYWFGYPLGRVYEIIEYFAGKAKHTHIKNLKFAEQKRNSFRKPGEDWPSSGATIYEGDIDHRKVLNWLRQAGYERDLTLEDESLGRFDVKERIGIVKEDLRFLRGLI